MTVSNENMYYVAMPSFINYLENLTKFWTDITLGHTNNVEK